MSEDIKIEVGKSMLKGFLTNPLAWVSLLFGIGAIVFNWGGSSASKKNDVSTIEKTQITMQADIKSIQSAISLQNQSFTLFSLKYDTDKRNAVILGEKIKREIIILDTTVDRHLRLTNRFQERFQFTKDQVTPIGDEKKNSSHLMIPLSDQNMTSILLSRKIQVR
jgi:hypothetical protein